MGRQRHARRPTPAVFVPPSVAELLGPIATTELFQALQADPPVSIRINPLKKVEIAGDVVPWCTEGRYLAERPLFTRDPRLHAGCYYVQEASSMLLEQALRACGPLDEDRAVLDLCAAPGGKSTHLASLLSPGSLLICNEPVATRRSILAENIWKHGRPGVSVGRANPEQLAAHGVTFDIVVVDAPCSGEGMFRKDPFAREQWSGHLVDTCARTQKDILLHAWAMVRPGGALIYSTCTWEHQENEAQLDQLIVWGGEPITIPMDRAWGVIASGPGYRCYPHRVRGEGFYIGAVRKPGSAGPRSGISGPGLSGPERSWVKEPDAYSGLLYQGTTYAMQQQWHRTVSGLANAGLLEHPGTPLHSPKGDAPAPHPALALNLMLAEDAFPVVELTGADVLRYLRGETVPSAGHLGWVLVKGDGHALGWAKGTSGRLNVHWPTPWRIRLR